MTLYSGISPDERPIRAVRLRLARIFPKSDAVSHLPKLAVGKSPGLSWIS